MNVDEARVPDVDANWSIEIFLFSNGQQYSPPRKYYLRADELSTWEDTLNYLATAHYGIRCPQISLYTTAGQLVEGPLGLNGGHAYVAVVEPDRFVDTGYQKYLIRASRSWEKRQARKKVSGYVPGDQCCLCPEKEWCCDPQTCCECPEIEDSCSQYSLLPATGHPELRPAGGHFMSSASTKPVVTGDYGPRSGRIGPISREHEVSGGYRNNPDENGYSPVPAPGKPEQYGTGLSVNESNPAEQATKLSGTGPRPGEYTARSGEFQPNFNENAGSPGNYEVNLSDHAARFNESEAELGEYEAKLNEHESRLSQNGEIPVEYEANTLIENESRLSNDVVKPGVYGARPDKYVPRPADYEKIPSRNGAARLDEWGINPGEYGARLNKNEPKPGEHETKRSRNGVRPDEYRARPAHKTKLMGKGATPNRNEARPGEHGARPGEYKSRPSINKAKPKEHVPGVSEYGPESNANGVKPSEYGVKPSEHETIPSVIRAQPSEYGTKSGEYAARPSVYETRSNVKRVRPAEINRERPDDIKGAKPGDSGPRPGKNEVLSGEAEIKHIRRISGQRGTEIQQGGRTVEPRVGEQKGRESNLAGRTGGQRVGDNGARLSEQSNKQHYFSPKLGGRVSKLGAQEEHPGDHGLRTIDHGTSSGIPPSRLTESSARTAPVSRPSPRDRRINSRVRTSDLGQPQSRTFTRVDGTAALLDNTEIKNTVGHPGTRPVSAGKTAVSGASHISEAQQHARKSNLLAGRPSTDKKRLPIGSTLLKQPTLISSVFRKLEDQQPIKTKEEILTKKTNEVASVDCVPASSAVVKSIMPPECTPSERTAPELSLLTISVTNPESPTTNIAHRENNIDENDKLTISTSLSHVKLPTSMMLDSIEHVVDSIENSPKETQTEIIYVGKSSAYDSINVEVQTHTEAVNTKQHAQETPASNKAKANSDTFQYGTDAEDTKQNAQEESVTNKAKIESDMFQTSTEAVDTKLNAQEESASNKVKADSDTFQYNIDVEDTKQHAQEESATNKAKIESDMFQTSTEAVDTKLNAQELAVSNKAKIDSATCCLCSQREQKLAIVDPAENTVAILYQGDSGTINLKLDIKIQNIVKSDYSCQKNCQGVHSVRNMTSEKESQISMEDSFLSRQESLHSLFHKSYSLGYGFSQFSPNVMVVQCAGCGRLNNGGCDPPQCCDNNKKYFVLLTNSLNEDMNDNCNCNPPCCPSDLSQLQFKKQSCIIPVKKSCSNMTLDTITTVTVSGVPLSNRCMIKTSSCQAEESHECTMSKHKVSITEELVTTPPTSEIQKKSSSSIPTLDISAKRSRLKICEEICPEIKENVNSLVCSRTYPVPCQKVPLACTKVSSPTTCPKVQTMGCQQTCPPVQTQGCSSVSSTCPTCNPGPLACIQIQTRVCPHVPQVCNKETQTQWTSLVLQARLHCDGRYSFHLPPLNVLNNFPF